MDLQPNMFIPEIPTSRTANSPYDLLARTKETGLIMTKTNTCNGNGAQADNIFQVTGIVDILRIWGIITEATDSGAFSANSLGLFDGATTVELTDSLAPTDASGSAVGDILYKNGASASVALAVSDRSTTGYVGDLTETRTRVGANTGFTNYIRHLFTGNANTDVDVKWYVEYVPVSDDGAIAAV